MKNEEFVSIFGPLLDIRVWTMERGATTKVGSDFTFSAHESSDRGKGL